MPTDNTPLESMVQSIYDEERTYQEEALKTDKNWLEASRNVYKHINKSDFQGSDEELAREGLEIMGKFNYNMALGTVPMAMNIDEATDDEKLSFYYMMDAYDKKDISADGVGRFFKNVGLDPTTYIGIGTLGAGFAGKQALARTAKEGVKATLKKHIQKYLANTTAVGATEGAIYSAVDDIARQEVSVEAGVQKAFSPAQAISAGTVGAMVGGGIVKGGEMAAKQVGKWAKEGEQEMMKMAGGGTPPDELPKYVHHGSSSESIKALKKDFKILTPEEKLKIGGTGAGKIGLSLSIKPSVAKKYSQALGSRDIASFEVNPKAKVLKIDTKGNMIDEIYTDEEMNNLIKQGYDAILDIGNETEFEYRALTPNAIKSKRGTK